MCWASQRLRNCSSGTESQSCHMPHTLSSSWKLSACCARNASSPDQLLNSRPKSEQPEEAQARLTIAMRVTKRTPQHHPRTQQTGRAQGTVKDLARPCKHWSRKCWNLRGTPHALPNRNRREMPCLGEREASFGLDKLPEAGHAGQVGSRF